MKHQYFGDQTDYIKHGFLRRLNQQGLPLAVHWMLTADDRSTDGSRTKYLDRSDEWKHFDPELFEVISKSLRVGKRDLNVLVEHRLIDGINCCFDDWLDNHDSRTKSLDEFRSQLTRGSIVFFDPDNGLETPSVRPGARGSQKYLFFSEIRAFWEKRFSIIVYQHFPRVSRVEYVAQRLKQIMENLGVPEAAAIVTSHVAFLCVLQETNRDSIMQAIRNGVAHWAPHTYLLRLDRSGLSCEKPHGQQATLLQTELPM